MSGVKGRSGRKRNIANASKYFNELYDTCSFDLAKLTIDKALAGDRELLIYCHDRRLGKPKQSTDISLDADLPVNVIVGLLRAVREQIPAHDILVIEDKKEIDV